MSVLELFCDVDDFCMAFEPSWRHQVLTDGAARRHGVQKAYRINVDDLRAFAREYNYPLDEEFLAELGKS